MPSVEIVHTGKPEIVEGHLRAPVTGVTRCDYCGAEGLQYRYGARMDDGTINWWRGVHCSIKCAYTAL